MSGSNHHARLASTLQGIFGRVLRIEPRDIDVEAPFLELGADSLALVEALRGIQEAYGVKLTIRQLFEQLPSISVLAGFLVERVPDEKSDEKSAASPSKPHPRPLSRGERGDLAERVELAGNAVPAGEVFEDTQIVSPGNPARRSPPSPPGRGAGGEASEGTRLESSPSSVERVLSLQIQAFNQLVSQQLQALGTRGATVSSPIPFSPPVAVPAPPPAPPPAPAPIAKPVLPTHLGKVRPAAEMNERQRRHLEELVARYTRKTAKSKALTEAYRPWLADSRATVGFRPATKEMLYPLARHRSRGSRLWDVDGNEYVDVTMGMGVHLFGHDPEFLRETIERQVREGFELGPRSAHAGEVAALFCELTGMERAAFTNSGTEACMTALRLARARTGRTKIVMFAGSYHGHSDGTLAQTQEIEGVLRSFPVAPGVPARVAEDVLVLDYGTPESLEVIRRHRQELAAVIVEPIQSRRPEVQPREFLQELRRLTAESGIALIFDEMICGFRLHLGGAQAHFGVRADLATYGKVVGGGLPTGVVAGSADFMDGIDGGMWRYGDDSRPERETTFFGGTFCQHPLAMAAAKRVLAYLKEQGPGLQEGLNDRTARFAGRLNAGFESAGAPIRAVHAHSLFRFQSAANLDLLYYHLVDKGVYVWEWRNCFLSTAHTDADLDFVARAVGESVAELQRGGFLPEPPAGGGGGKAKGFWDRQGKPAIAPVVVEKGDRTDRSDRSDPSDAAADYAARGVQFSLYFFGHYPAEFKAGKYDLLFEAARFADRHGFSALWFPERHFHPFGGLSPNPSVLAAALARETERIGLRAGSVVLPLHHPLRVAEEWSLVDNLSGGRVGLSYASGWHPNDFALAPEAYGRHRELMFERIEEVRRLWRGEALRVRDGAGKEVDVRIFPRPARRELAEWITIVNNPGTWRRAGEMGVGVLTNLMGQTVEGLAGMVRIYREALAAAGHPLEKGNVTLLLHTYLDADPEAAVERARRPFYDYLESSVGLLQNMMASEGITADFDRMAEEDLEYMLEMAFQRYVSTSALIGSPETCAPIVERLRAVGVDEIACLIDFGVEPSLVAAGLPVLTELKDRFPGVEAEPVSASPISFPLTEAQTDLYTVAQSGDEALRAYYESGVLELRGPLDLGLLRQALQGEVDRHEALRTVFPPMGETQVVLPALRLEVPLLDATGCPPERQEEIAGGWLDELARDPFDLASGPLIRASVMRLEDRQSLRHLLSIAVHHIAADGLSIGILVGEVFAAYESLRAGCRPALPRPMQLREYAAWLSKAWTAERQAEDEAYWLSELSGELPVFEPPTDYPRPPVLTLRGRRQRTVLAAVDRERILRFGRRHGATLYMTLLAAWTALLHRWTGQDDLIVGSAQARRPLEGGDRLVGHCTDIVPLRSRLEDGRDGEPTFLRHLAAVRGRVLGAHDHGELAFSRLVRRLDLRRDTSRSPLVNTIFNLDPDWAIGPAGGLEIAERSPAMPFVKFDLAVHSLSSGERLVVYLDSRSDLFDAVTTERLSGRLVALLEGAMEDPERPLGELPWMTGADRAQLVAEVAVPYPRERTVHALFAEVAAERPDAVAIEAGDRRLTYGELDGLASAWAGRLRDLSEMGVGTDARVATVLERSPELIIGWLAALEAGGAYVPLDPGFPEERLARLLTSSGAVAVLTVEEHREKVERALERAGLTLPILLLDAAVPPPLPGRGAGRPGEEGRGGEGLAYVTYTSGSTGEPKGVAVPHRAVVRLVRETDYAPLGPDDRAAHLAHVAFDATTFEVWGPLLNGGRVVVLDRDTAVSPHRLAAALRDRGVTALFLTGALFNQMAAEEPAAFAGVRFVLTGGEAADPNRFRAVLAAGAPIRLANAYGPTECTTFALWEPVDAVPEGAVSLPIGRPVANTRICILQGCEPVPPGVDGELCLGGDGLARGYLGRPDLTAERFVPDPLASTPGERLYRTGDRARLRLDGRVEYYGRLDRQVKIRGFRVEPGEVEAALAAHPGVREVVVGVGQNRLGEAQLVAWLVPNPGADFPTDRDLRGFLAARLPAPMIPAVFTPLSSLPLTASGKVDRRALAALAPEPAAAAKVVVVPAPSKPLTATVDVLSGLWADVLGRERVGPDDDFFELGGHSLLATRVLLRVRSLFGLDLPMHVLLDLPTPALFAARIEQELGTGAVSEVDSAPMPDEIPVERRAPLSFSQERLWFFSRLAPRSKAYNLPAAFRLTGPLDPDALVAALGEIVRRHEALRTVFAEGEDGEPEQWVRAFTGFALPRVDLSALPDPQAAARDLILEEAQRPFDLRTGPLQRPFLLRLGPEAHTLLLAAHHILTDGWSFGVLGHELAVLYRAALANAPSPLPPLPIQYADFAIWQRSWLQGEVLASLAENWRRNLAGHPGVIELPTDRPRPALQSFLGAIERLPFDSPTAAGELRDRLRRLGVRYRATPFMVALAALQIVLLHHTGEEDMLVGTPIASRNRENIEGLIGFFVNTLPLRTDLSGDPTFTSLVARVRESTLRAYAHQDLPFDKLVEAVAPTRDLSRNPLVQVVFAFQNTILPDRHLAPGLACDLEYIDGGTAKFDLTFFLEEDGLAGGVEYATDLFDAATVRRLQGHFLTVVRAAASAPDEAISELPILTPEERWQVIEAWNGTAAEYPREISVHRLFESVAARDPQAPAVLWEGGTLSYGELDRWAGRLARRLRAQGAGPEVAVTLDLERSPELVVAMLAVLKAGGFYVPLDAADPAERRALILEDVGAAVRLGHDDVTAVIAARDGEEDAGPSAEVDPEGLAYVIYTSGSTGRPKGVAVFHRALVRLVVNSDYVRPGPADRMAHVSNTAFDVAAFEVWGALLNGASLVIIPREVVLSPAALGAMYRRWGITMTSLTPSLFNEVMREAPDTLAGVRHLLVAGEAVTPRWMREARAVAPEQRLLNAYGPTEATVFAAWHPVETVPEGAASVPIGLPIANTRLYVVDRRLRPVPLGVPGELCIAGGGLARGYLRRPELTAERFVPDPFDAAGGGRMYRTGDLARRLTDGAIDYLGRTDAQVKVRGFRIELGEIEAVLSRAPGVRECAVLVRELPEGGRRLVAWVALEEGTAADLRGFLRERLPDFMVPAVFAPLDAFPRTPSGKVDRRALARLEPPGGSGSEPGFEAPRTPVEQIVAGVWAEVLGLRQVSVRDSFFDLGGHSLLAGRVLSRLRNPLGVDLSLSEFFQDPTVAGLARRVEAARQERRGETRPPLVPRPRDERPRLSFAQERLWLIDQLQPGSTAYNTFLPLGLRGRLDVEALTRSLIEIARRHEVLRTHYALSEGGPVQRIEPVSWLGLSPLSRVDLDGLPIELARTELGRLAARRSPFDLARGPLLRAVLVRVAADEHALLVDMHHSVCDGWSVEVMTRELSALYRAFSAAQPSPLKELPVQYAGFAQWQRQWLQGEVVESQLAWWRERLGENPPPLDLPTDRPRPAVPSSRGESRGLLLSPELSARLGDLARRQGGTLFIALLAGYQALLHHHTRQERIAVGTPVAGRTRVEIEELIGLFVNTLVLATDVDDGMTGSELLDRAREATLGAFDHQDLPFEQLVAALVRERDPGRQPIFQTLFVLQNNARTEPDLGDLTLAVLPAGGVGALFDLTLGAMETDEGIVCGMTWAADLFDPPTILRFLEQYRRLLESLVEDPGRPLAQIPLLSAAERHQLEVEPPPVRRPHGDEAPAAAPAAPTEEERRAEIERRRSEVASRRGQLSAGRRSLLRKWVGGGANPSPPAEAPPAVNPLVNPLVELRSAGSRPPLFLVHAAGGLVHDYVGLAERLDPGQPLYALQSPALEGGEHFATVPEMAARYVDAVRSVQRRGPYRLGGYCVGGAVAFEMARQLHAAGEEAEGLVLIDSHGPRPSPWEAIDDAEMLASFVRTYGGGVEVSAEELRTLSPDEWIGRVVARAREAGGVAESFGTGQLRRRWEVMRSNVHAIASYVPAGPLPLGAVLFRATRQSEESRDQPVLGWERWLEGAIEVVDVEGGHLEVFQEPGIEALVLGLQGLRVRTAVDAAV